MNGMGEVASRIIAASAPASPTRSRVLTSWKEVAGYMGKGVRTVQRWERDFGLPVRRPSRMKSRRAVLALTVDLDSWVALRCSRGRRDPRADASEPGSVTLRDRMKTAAALRITNHVLMNEIQIAVETLRQKLAEMCPAYGLSDSVAVLGGLDDGPVGIAG
jgi:transcriptional regulator with XRE-family HTH domain